MIKLSIFFSTLLCTFLSFYFNFNLNVLSDIFKTFFFQKEFLIFIFNFSQKSAFQCMPLLFSSLCNCTESPWVGSVFSTLCLGQAVLTLIQSVPFIRSSSNVSERLKIQMFARSRRTFHPHVSISTSDPEALGD